MTDIMPFVGEALLEEEDVLCEFQGGSKGDNTSTPTFLQDACGVLVLQWFGLPVSCDKNGPFSVADLNLMLAPLNLHLSR